MDTNNTNPNFDYDEYARKSREAQEQVAATLVDLPLTDEEREVLLNDFAFCSSDVRQHSIQAAYRLAYTRITQLAGIDPTSSDAGGEGGWMERTPEHDVVDMLGGYVIMAQTFHDHGVDGMPAAFMLLDLFTDGLLEMVWSFDSTDDGNVTGQIALTPSQEGGEFVRLLLGLGDE